MTVTLQSLLTITPYEQFYQKALDVAEAVGLPVTSWRDGDPTKTFFAYLAEALSTLEPVVQRFVTSGFLDYAEEDWLTVLAKQVYGVDRQEATYAAGTLTLENTGGGQYTFDPGELTFKSTVTGRTYHNSNATFVASGPGTFADPPIEWIADEAGSDSTVAADEIDELITSQGAGTLEISASGAGIGLDAQSDASLRTACRDSIGALSPNGPPEAYVYVARNSKLTGVTDVTKAKSLGDSETGDVTLYIAGPSGPVAGASVTAVANAIAIWATPLTITPTVSNATAVPVAFEIDVYIRDSVGANEAAVQEAVQSKIEALVAGLDIGGDVGFLFQDRVKDAAFAAFPGYVLRAPVVSPASDVALALENGEVATVDGAIVVNVTFEEAS